MKKEKYISNDRRGEAWYNAGNRTFGETKGRKGKAMVLILTGASHTGKTLLSQRLLEAHGVPYLSVDHLKMGLIRSGLTPLTPEDDDKLTEYLWPIEREIIKTAIENRQNLIVEGCYVPFDWRKDFDEPSLASIRFLCLALSDAYIDAHADAIKAHANDIETRLFDDCDIDWLKAENRAYAEGFSHAGERVVLIEKDYERTVGTLVSSLLL